MTRQVRPCNCTVYYYLQNGKGKRENGEVVVIHILCYNLKTGKEGKSCQIGHKMKVCKLYLTEKEPEIGKPFVKEKKGYFRWRLV